MLSLIPLAGSTIHTYILGVRHHIKIRLLPDFQSSFIISLVLKGATSPESPSNICILISLHMLHAMFSTLPIIAQPYQAHMFQAILTLGFFGLFSPSELTVSQHVICFNNIQCAADWVLIKMDSSKCNKMVTPQLLRVHKQLYAVCPVRALQNYLAMRPAIQDSPLFIHLDSQPVTSHESPVMRAQLGGMLSKLSIFLNLPHQVIKPHSLRIGGTTDLYLHGVPPNEIQQRGHWSSECFKKYIRL